MSMTGDRDDRADRDDIIAGEYVLGVLSAKDRAAVEARLKTDAAFAARISGWESNLSSLNDDYAEAAPPARVFQAVESRLFAIPEPSKVGLWASVAFWRGLAFASLAVVAGLGIWDSGVLTPIKTVRPLVAELSADGSNINLVALYDNQSGTLKLTPAAAGKPEEKSLELWMIDGNNPAVSLGVLPASGNGEVTIPEPLRNKLTEGMVLAVSLEPFGGSPTGKATGPILAVGKARSL